MNHRTKSNWQQTLPAVMLGLFALATCAQTASAQLIRRPRDLDPFNRNGSLNQSMNRLEQERLRRMSQSPRPGRDYTKVFVQNKTNRPIWVAIHYIPYYGPTNTSDLKVTSSSWSTKGWYRVNPGSKIYVAKTANRYVYTHANDSRGARWSGSLRRTVVDPSGNRQTVGFGMSQFNAGRLVSYTINFN